MKPRPPKKYPRTVKVLDPNLSAGEVAFAKVYAARHGKRGDQWVDVADVPKTELPSGGHHAIWRYLRNRGCWVVERAEVNIFNEERWLVHACWTHGDL